MNPQPTVLETVALPIELLAYVCPVAKGAIWRLEPMIRFEHDEAPFLQKVLYRLSYMGKLVGSEGLEPPKALRQQFQSASFAARISCPYKPTVGIEPATLRFKADAQPLSYVGAAQL